MIVGLKFLTSFSVTVLWGGISIILYYDVIKRIKIIGDIMILGVVFTLSMYIFFLLLILNSRFIKAILRSPLIATPMRLLLRKEKQELLKSIDEKVEGYKRILSSFWRSSKTFFFLNILLTTIMIFFILVTSYLSMEAVTSEPLPLLKILGLQVAINMIVYFTPTPGASGGVEGVFYLVFSSVASKAAIAAALIIWRFFTYYMVIIIGNITSVRFALKNGSRNGR